MFEICIHVQGLALVVFLALMYQTEQEDGILSFESSVFLDKLSSYPPFHDLVTGSWGKLT